MNLKILIKALIFTAGLVLMFDRLTILLTLKGYPVEASVNTLISPYDLCDKQDGFYSEPDNSLDVVFLGSSCVHCNINPNVIWKGYGIASYDFACDRQELGTSYYYLKQVFKTQSPKVVVIDIMNGGSEEAIDNERAHFAFDHMKTDLSRIEAIWNRTKEERLEMYLPLIAYHERWKNLSLDDFKYVRYRHNPMKGTYIRMVSNKREEVILPDNMPVGELSERTVFWLDHITALCEENDCECLFIKTPYSFYDEEKFAYFNAAEKYLNDRDIPFIYFNKIIGETGLDFNTDYMDEWHMNWEGQQKFSDWLGHYLKDNYGLSDRRGDPKYSKWDEDYECMMSYIDLYRRTADQSE